METKVYKPTSLNTINCINKVEKKSDLAVLRMLSQQQSETEPGAEPTSSSSACSGADGLQAGAAGGSGAVTPGSGINGEGSTEFLSTGRTGRRNAMPDILGEHAETGTADLPEKLEALTTG